ncbi:type I 3-dehydroquinate dehydratase [Leptospira fletcheri]|uniref:3-dehydroquinate dehydratase n=1 Tax=Leptospira fletcheri TaxID=2484981 RepID=A0A4R9GI66_9LEPT|nr:type I 3-dehydroquinate dehydratase [Leptospira fletcheri]TGK11713.1 type I 3-dehydroquinate dehydratase [Leptospira fletcheri]
MSQAEKIYTVLTLDEEEFFALQNLPPADFMEIRLDLFLNESGKPEKILDILEKLSARAILTYRQPEDSSVKARSIWTQEDVTPFLRKLQGGNHYLDVELDKDNSIFTEAEDSNFGIVRSIHSFSGILGSEELEFYFRTVAEEAIGSRRTNLPFDRILKVAVMPDSEEESREFVEISRKISELVKEEGTRFGYCGILMGDSGKEFRIFPEKIGSQFTYACFKNPKAPGQVGLQELLESRKNGF